MSLLLANSRAGVGPGSLGTGQLPCAWLGMVESSRTDTQIRQPVLAGGSRFKFRLSQPFISFSDIDGSGRHSKGVDVL